MNFNEPAGNSVPLDRGRTGGERRHDLVLLVDHDPAARARAAAALSARCWRVIEAGGGAEALEIFAAHRPDIVVLDASSCRASTGSPPASDCGGFAAASTCRS